MPTRGRGFLGPRGTRLHQLTYTHTHTGPPKGRSRREASSNSGPPAPTKTPRGIELLREPLQGLPTSRFAPREARITSRSRAAAPPRGEEEDEEEDEERGPRSANNFAPSWEPLGKAPGSRMNKKTALARVTPPRIKTDTNQTAQILASSQTRAPRAR